MGFPPPHTHFRGSPEHLQTVQRACSAPEGLPDRILDSGLLARKCHPSPHVQLTFIWWETSAGQVRSTHVSGQQPSVPPLPARVCLNSPAQPLAHFPSRPGWLRLEPTRLRRSATCLRRGPPASILAPSRVGPSFSCHRDNSAGREGDEEDTLGPGPTPHHPDRLPAGQRPAPIPGGLSKTQEPIRE